MPCCRSDSNNDQSGRNAGNNGPNNSNYYEKCQNQKPGIENSTRFSIRVMEAMRSLQKRNNDRSLTSSNIKDIAEYIKANYNFDGDLDAQVQTVLSRIWRQGFTMKISEDDYILIGPFATCINKVHNFLTSKSSGKRKHKSRSRSRCSKKRKKEKKSKRNGKNVDAEKINENPPSENLEENLTGNKIVAKCREKNFPAGKNKSSLRKKNQSSTKNRSKRVKKLKTAKKKNRSAEKTECKYGRTHDNSEMNEDFQSVNSPNTFVTCEELNTNERLMNGNKIFNTVSNLRNNDFHKSSEIIIDDESTTNSEGENSSDSVYQELKSKKINELNSNKKDLKKWIKHCRQKCPRN